jgi:hypothetical protein
VGQSSCVRPLWRTSSPRSHTPLTKLENLTCAAAIRPQSGPHGGVHHFAPLFLSTFAWTNIEERHVVTIARHPVLLPAFRGARRSRDLRWRTRSQHQAPPFGLGLEAGVLTGLNPALPPHLVRIILRNHLVHRKHVIQEDAQPQTTKSNRYPEDRIVHLRLLSAKVSRPHNTRPRHWMPAGRHLGLQFHVFDRLIQTRINYVYVMFCGPMLRISLG